MKDVPYNVQINIFPSKSITMKLCTLVIASTLAVSVSAFSAAGPARAAVRPLSMFTGAGEGVPSEDDPEALASMEASAKAMGMTLDEYKLGINARQRLTSSLDSARLVSGDVDTVSIERDGHNPPKYLEVTITEAGKALGKDEVSKKLIAAIKASSDESKVTRAEAQKDMMMFISEEMKKVG